MECLYDEHSRDKILTLDLDYVIDCIDHLPTKIDLIAQCAIAREGGGKGLRVIAACGAGAKADPTELKVTRIEKTSECRLAKAVRNGLK